ncbi:MAG: hypothetical protein NZ958_01430 [Bacteroidia bacterium]|nr:hypothetical protein [Bacteroidia bacterium]MDW8089326.1 hypothetical protein [Bacteroidia bacterium]
MAKKWLIEWVLPLSLLIAVSGLYFFPYYEGYRFRAADQEQVNYMGYPMEKWHKETGKQPFWAPNLFSGMPAYLVYYPEKIGYFPLIRELIGKLMRHYPPAIFLVGLLGFFLLLRVEGVGWGWALGGAFGFALTSYYTNMIVATHWGKSNVIFQVPYLLAGMGLLHRGRWGWGVVLALSGWAGMVGGHHPQMLYYSLLVVAAYEVAWLVRTWQNRNWAQYGWSIGLIGLTAAIGGLSHINRLLPYGEYGRYSIRGPTELEREIQADPRLKGGLPRDYAQSYSCSRAELWTVVIPDFVGGTSYEDLLARLGAQSALRQIFLSHGARDVSFLHSVPTYWGGLPFAAGSFYVSVIAFFLIILGWTYRMEALDWAFLYGVWIALLLALGANSYSLWGSALLLALPLLAYLAARRRASLWEKALVATAVFLGGWAIVSYLDDDPASTYKLADFALEYLPFYNKFRAPSTWLVVLGFFIPWLGMVGVQRFLAEPDLGRLAVAAATVCLILLGVGVGGAWIGFSFESESDAVLRSQMPDWFAETFMEALRVDRMALARLSAFRSVLWTLATAAVLLLVAKKFLMPVGGGVFVALFMLVDGWRVNTLYFPRNKTYEPKKFLPYPPPLEPYEAFILRDTVGYFRILPLHVNTFTDNRPGVYLENAGGYHPAKLKRYQQFIEAHLQKLSPAALEMLAIRYITVGAKQAKPPLPAFYDSLTQTTDSIIIYRSREPLPIAWLAAEIRIFPRVDQTLDSLGRYPVRSTALIAARDWTTLKLKPENMPLDSAEGVVCLERNPYRLRYKVHARRPRLLVMSEIYYPPDWKATVNGQEASIIPVNFILRGVVVPPGDSEVELICHSRIHELGERLAKVGSLLAWLLIIATFLLSRRKRPAA